MQKRLILGCGSRTVKSTDFEDILLDVLPLPGVDVVHDLNIAPWPFDDGGFMHLSALHLVEHLQSLVSFMNEAWRVLAPGGSLYIETPMAGADIQLQYADPTHVRCYTQYSFINYFTPEGIDAWHYTDKAWCIYKVGTHPNNPAVLIFHGSPIKPLVCEKCKENILGI